MPWLREGGQDRLAVDVTFCILYFSSNSCSTCFGQPCAHHQELATVMLITTLVISSCKDGGSSVNVNLWFLVVCVQCEVLCGFVVAGNVFLLILIVVIFCVW